MRRNLQTIGLFVSACSALSCAPGALAASEILASGATGGEAMQATGGVTLGSAALVALAGAIVAFGKASVKTPGSESGSNRRNEWVESGVRQQHGTSL